MILAVFFDIDWLTRYNNKECAENLGKAFACRKNPVTR